MLRPTDIEELKGSNSRYAVVIGVAKRAREIADEASEKGEILVEKNVSMAIHDLKTGDCTLSVPDDEEMIRQEKANAEKREAERKALEQQGLEKNK